MAKSRILVVEDEVIEAEDIKGSLQKMGYEVPAIVSWGHEAVEKAMELKPDLVLMDIVLRNKMNGVEAASAIRTRLNIPVIYLTAYADEDTLQRAKITEPFGYIVKPFEARELHSAIEIALYRHRMEDVLRQSEKKYRTLFESANEVIYLIDPDSRKIIDCNMKAVEITGYSCEELKTKKFDELFPIEQHSVVTGILKKAAGIDLLSGISGINHVSKDGKLVPIEINAAVVEIDGKHRSLWIVRDMTEQKRVEEMLRENDRYNQSLLRLYELLGRASSYTAIIEALASEIRGMLGYNSAWLVLIEPGADHFRVLQAKGTVEKSAETLMMDERFRREAENEQFLMIPIKGDAYVEEVAEATHLVIVEDARTDPRTSKEMAELSGNRTIVNVPVRLADKKLGVFATGTFGDEGVRVPTERELDYLRAMANHVAVAMDRVRFLAERKKAEDELRKFKFISDNANDAHYLVDSEGKFWYVNRIACEKLGYSEEELLGLSVPEVDTVFDKERFQKLFKDIQTKRVPPFETINKRKDGKTFPSEVSATGIELDGISYMFAVVRDITERKKAEQALRQAESKMRTIVNSAQVGVYQTNLEGKLLFSNEAFLEMLGYESMADANAHGGAPAFYKDAKDREVFLKRLREASSLNNYELQLRTKTGSIRDFYISANLEGDILSGTLVDTTERRKAEKDLESSYEKLKKVLDGVVATLSAIVETRDPYIIGHQSRVAKLARAIAAEMGLSGVQIETIGIAARLHDIGKVSIPTEILSKPGAITEFEFAIIKNHPQIAHQILEKIEFESPIRQIIAQHHERVEGSGYPKGLSGEGIMIEARILGVADVVEAMSSHRPYRPALGTNEALAEIVQNKGKLYDSRVVEACVKLFSEQGFSFDEGEPTSKDLPQKATTSAK